MVVFDPLAVLLLIAANLTLTLGKKEEIKPEGWKQEWVPESESWPPYDWPEDNNRVDIVGQNGNDGEHYGEVDKNTVEVEKENITNIEEPVAEDINQYESPAKQKVETHHVETHHVETHHAPGIYEEENVPFDHVKYK
jgi:hypothetical protein